MKENIEKIKDNVQKQKKISSELNSLYDQLKKSNNNDEKALINSQIKALKGALVEANKSNTEQIRKTNISKPLSKNIPEKEKKELKIKRDPKQEKILEEIEIRTLGRLKNKKVKKVVNKEYKPSKYTRFANNLFSKTSRKLLKEGKFKSVERGIIKSKLRIVPSSYISALFLSTILSVFVALLIYVFFIFFNLKPILPIITLAEGDLILRALSIIWIPIFLPLATFFMMYIYPTMEVKSAELKINQELPFATIHMSAISGSMIEPSKIFEIIVSTKEYPYLEKEFTRLLNEINLYGYDLVTSLKNISANSPSKKLGELLNGLATTIASGGNLPDFFDKRAESLLFDYKIEREKYTKSAETFMDIYISVVIAAPMILMLLLIMMKISGLGLSLSTGTITLMTVLGVFLINIVFLTFLHLKQPVE